MSTTLAESVLGPVASRPKINHRTIPGLIKEKKEFKGSNITGQWRTYTPAAGRLDNIERKIMEAQCVGGRDMYVVTSYQTPIAWYTDRHGWYKVRQKFSQTTSRQQGLLYMV